MKPSTLITGLCGGAFSVATYVCPAKLGSGDTAALVFAYKIQGLLSQYYDNTPINATFFSSLPNSDMKGSNGRTLAQNTVTNVEGLGKQAMLGSEALMNAVSETEMMSMCMSMGMGMSANMSSCDYMYPAAPNGTEHLLNAYYFEATLCGAFIGLADYTTTPEAAFLMARLAAEHGIHAAAIRTMMQPVGFMPNSTSLTPAFTPDTVVMKGDGMEVGMLGMWLNGCSSDPPKAPCGGKVKIGMLGANLTGQTGSCCQ